MDAQSLRTWSSSAFRCQKGHAAIDIPDRLPCLKTNASWRLIGALRRLTSKMAAIAKADWQIHDWRGELIDRRLDYYHEGHEEHEGFH